MASDRECSPSAAVFLYLLCVVERNPCSTAFQAPPSCGRSFAGLDLHYGINADRDILRPCVVRAGSLADIEVADADLHEERNIANEHDYLGNGKIFHEDRLNVGQLYHLIDSDIKSIGEVVFLKEVPSRFGFQAYLFEETEEYDEKVYKAGAYDWFQKNVVDVAKQMKDGQ